MRRGCTDLTFYSFSPCKIVEMHSRIIYSYRRGFESTPWLSSAANRTGQVHYLGLLVMKQVFIRIDQNYVSSLLGLALESPIAIAIGLELTVSEEERQPLGGRRV